MNTETLELPTEYLTFLSRLPMLLNSNLALRPVVDVGLRNLAEKLNCKAATVFVLKPGGKELTFWAFKGGSSTLESQVIQSDKGIVGWVIQNRSSAVVDDAQNDPRLLQQVGSALGSVTHNMICCPLIVRGEELLAAVQVLNKQSTLSVQDTGIGTALQERHLILEKFYEVTDVLHHSSGSREFKFCGLGLSTGKTILDAHGINISLTSEVGKGTTFSFVFPSEPLLSETYRSPPPGSAPKRCKYSCKQTFTINLSTS